jgi:hypothetical protein
MLLQRYRAERLPGEDRFHELVFGNVVIYPYGPDDWDMTDSAEPDIQWIAFARLCERADLIRLRDDSGERMIERSE